MDQLQPGQEEICLTCGFKLETYKELQMKIFSLESQNKKLELKNEELQIQYNNTLDENDDLKLMVNIEVFQQQKLQIYAQQLQLKQYQAYCKELQQKHNQ